MTCEPCRTSWARPERLEIYDTKQRGVLLHDNFASLQHSAENGCQLCELFLKLTTDIVEEDKRNRNRVRILPESSQFHLHVGIHTTAAQTNHHSGSSTLIANADVKSRFGNKKFPVFKHHWHQYYEVVVDRSVTNKTLRNSIPGREVVEDPISPECLAVIKDWIAQCDESHVHCKEHFADKRLPSRTIDVGPPDGSVEPRLCIHDRNEDAEDFRWLALSHRWGNIVPIKTTKSSLEGYQKAIPFESLPRSFQDAVIVTRKLGVRHLWIDSLCIIQDDPSDWLSEYPKMGTIFEQAFLTLAADNAPDCSAGFLHPRPLTTILSFPWSQPTSTSSHPSSSPSQISIRRGLKPWKSALNDRESAIHARGWILQEDLLAPRTLHFARAQLFWECRTHRCAEALSAPFRNFTDLNLTTGKSFMRLGGNGTLLSKRLAADPDLLVYSEWAVIVKDYTKRQLTFASDKLPALVGAAEAFRRRLATENRGYCAGMWEANLHKDLLWRGKFGETLTRVSGRAPSWSWASVEGAVLFPRHMGPARDGYIADVIKSVEWPFRSPSHVVQDQEMPLTVSSLFVEAVRFDSVSNDMPSGYGDNGFRLLASDGAMDDVLCYFDVRDEQAERVGDVRQGLCLLCIAKFVDGPRQVSFRGLLLERTGKEGEYRRMGTVKIVRQEEKREGYEGDAQEVVLRGWERKEVRIV